MENDLIVNDDEKLVDLVEQYVEAKSDEFKVLSLDERFSLFVGLIKDSDYAKHSFAEVDNFKQIFFDKNEIAKIGINNLDNHLSTFVVADKYAKEYKLIVLLSKTGIKKGEMVNKDNTFAFEVSFKDHSAQSINIKLLKSKLTYEDYKVCKLEEMELAETENEELQNLSEAFEQYLSLSAEKEA